MPAATWFQAAVRRPESRVGNTARQPRARHCEEAWPTWQSSFIVWLSSTTSTTRSARPLDCRVGFASSQW